MCGIFGMTGLENNCNDVLEGIKKLEYRGYDSAGIAFLNHKKIKILKTVGEISALEKLVKKENPVFSCGIAHTRWATHGEPSTINAHPHTSLNKQFALVHNGIIENFKELKETYLKGVTLTSQTDTEVIVQLIEKLWELDTLTTLKKVCDLIKGSYAFCLLNKLEPNKIYVAKKDSPLIVANYKNVSFVSSDVSAIVPHTREQFILNNNEYAVLSPESILFFNKDLTRMEHKMNFISESTKETLLSDYPHFMLKEIHEVPMAIENTLNAYSSLETIYKVIPKKLLQKTKHIKIIACGTAYHAGLIGKKLIEHFNHKLTVEVEVASEFRYANTQLQKNTLCIFISQSGETADTIAALKRCIELGAKTLSITNVKNSSITYAADYNLYTEAGREIAVASTKAYNSQLTMLYLLAATFSKNAKESYNYVVENIHLLLKKEDYLHELEKNIIALLKNLKEVNSIYLIGRQLDYDTAKEASLKLKEITYTHCEAYPAGELKHGTLSLIEENSLVICFLTQKHILDKTLNGLFEVKSRGAKVLLITNQEVVEKNVYDELIYLPFEVDLFLPIMSIVPVQLLSYYMSVKKGINPDKPRNLAKAVTVE